MRGGWAAAGTDPSYALLVATMMAAGFGTSFALGGSLLASAAGYGTGLRTSMAVGALAHLAAAVLAWLCVPAKSKGT